MGTTDVYEAGLSSTFNAWHVMPGAEGPEGRLHQHDYRLEVVASRRELDERGMVCDLDVIEAALRDTVGMVEGKDLEAIRPPDKEAVTVEVLARWAHDRLAGRLLYSGIDELKVRVWESPLAFGGYSGPVRNNSS